MSAPLVICPACGKAKDDHETVGGAVICAVVGRQALIVRRWPSIWPLGGGKWEVRA